MRIRFLKNFISTLFYILIVSLWYIQCVQGSHYNELSQKNRIRLFPLVGPRGNIYDRNGSLLAGSRLAFNCAIIPQEFKADEEKLLELSSMLQMQPGLLKKKIEEDIIAPFIPLVLKKDIGKETAIAISERDLDFPGLIIQTYPTRYYPDNEVCSHFVGYLGRISEEELSGLRDYGYKVRDFVGRGELELFYDDYLKGEDGGVQTEVDSRGRELRVLGIREPQKGRDIVVTIDLELQKYIDSLLKEYNGAVIVMGSYSGEIMSLVSKPDFDPNIFVSATESAVVKGLLQSRDYPFMNRAISATYPPGSIFKIVTATAALELNKIGKEEQLDCKGAYFIGDRQFDCWKKSGHGSQTLIDGVRNSCNIFFYQLGQRIGVNGLADYAPQYGFGKSTGIDLPYEADGIVPTSVWKRQYKRQPWYEGDTVNYAIGQGYLLTTPIQVLRMVNTVATEGELLRPYLVKEIDGVELASLTKRELDISKRTFKIIKSGMKKAVEDPAGTAAAAKVEGLEIAGKTGTAQTGYEETHAWFSGFSPVEMPKVSLVVFIEYGGKGGGKSSEIAANIFAKLKELGYL